MKRSLFISAIIAAVIFTVSCSQKDTGAQDHLNQARQLYADKAYIEAQQLLDTLPKLYPKAFAERRAALALLDSVRRDYQTLQIAICDSLINANLPALNLLKSQFVFQQNKEYQDQGIYSPKETANSGQIQATTLRSGVEENGALFIESVFVGSSKKHNKLKVTAKDGSFAETLAVNDDGLNYRFNTGERQYEVIRFIGADENGVSRFISANANQPLTLTLEGQAKYSYTLSSQLKTAIAKSYQLSVLMSQMDSLNNEKEKAKVHISYLDNGKKLEITDKEEAPQQ